MKQFSGMWLPDGEIEYQKTLIKDQQWRGGRLCYQADKVDLALSFVASSKRRVAVDAGANIGFVSMLLAWNFKRVVAFEPCLELATILPHNIAAPNVELHQVALGDREGVVSMRESKTGCGGNHIDAGAAGDVRLATLDSFNLDEVDFIKVDVEGYELPFAQGARNTLLKCKPVIMIEQKGLNPKNEQDRNRSALGYLEKLGMRRVAHIDVDYILTF